MPKNSKNKAKPKLKDEIGYNCGNCFQPPDPSENLAWLLGGTEVLPAAGSCSHEKPKAVPAETQGF